MIARKKEPPEPARPAQRIRFTDPLFAHLNPVEDSLPPVLQEGNGGARRIEARDGMAGQKDRAVGGGTRSENPKGKGKRRVTGGARR